MSRRDIILVVSRAIAIIQLISALLEMTYIPGRLYSLSHHSKAIIASGGSDVSIYLWTDDRISLAMFMLRIAILMIFAALFWNCRPWVEQLLCPSVPRDFASAALKHSGNSTFCTASCANSCFPRETDAFDASNSTAQVIWSIQFRFTARWHFFPPFFIDFLVGVLKHSRQRWRNLIRTSLSSISMQRRYLK